MLARPVSTALSIHSSLVSVALAMLGISIFLHRAPRLSGRTSLFGVVFFCILSLLRIEREKKPSHSVDNTILDLQNSSYPTQPHLIIANYTEKQRNTPSGVRRIFNNYPVKSGGISSDNDIPQD